MAVILINPNKESKGVLILKHLEVEFWIRQPLQLINEIKDKYHVGIYFGFYTELNSDIRGADFYVAEDNVLKFSFETSIPRLNLNGYNFLQGKDWNINYTPTKTIDFIFIGNYSRRKRALYLIENLERLKYSNDDFNAVLVIMYRGGLIEYFTRHLIHKKAKNFKQVSLIEVSNKKGIKLSKTVIKALLERSKFLVIPSTSEGAARVIAESKLLDCRVISYSKMLGGSNNHLDPDEDFLYEKDLYKVLSEALRIKANHITDEKIKKLFLEEYSREKLKKFLQDFFALDLIQTESIDSKILENLFQSHQQTLPRDIPTNKNTDECLSKLSLTRFLFYSIDSHLTQKQIFLLRIEDYYIQVKSKLKLIVKIFTHFWNSI